MDSVKKTGTLKSDPIIMKNGNMYFATFRFYACTMDENGKTTLLTPMEMVYVTAFGGLASFAETSLRKGYTVTVAGQQNSNGKAEQNRDRQKCTNMVAEEIEIISRPEHAGQIPEPLRKTEGAICREEYEANGGFRTQEPVYQSWEDGETVEDFHE